MVGYARVTSLGAKWRERRRRRWSRALGLKKRQNLLEPLEERAMLAVDSPPSRAIIVTLWVAMAVIGVVLLLRIPRWLRT